MRATVDSAGRHRDALDRAVERLGRQRVQLWLIDHPIAESVRRAREAPARARTLAVVEADEAEAAWAELGNAFDEVILAPFQPAELDARLRALATRTDPDRHARSRSLRLVAHDVNNPLTAIRLLAEMLVMEMPDEESRQDMRDILEASDLAGALIESLSAAARLDHPAPRETAREVDLVGVVQRVGRRPAFAEHIDIDVRVDSCALRAEPSRLQQAVTDLLLHARKLSEGRGRPSLTIEVQGDHVDLVLTLSGTRLEEDHRAALLLPWGAWSARDDQIAVAATGLGHVTQVTRELGGTLHIDVDTEPSTWRVRLPLPGT